jgi:hypothetical protein
MTYLKQMRVIYIDNLKKYSKVPVGKTIDDFIIFQKIWWENDKKLLSDF